MIRDSGITFSRGITFYFVAMIQGLLSLAGRKDGRLQVIASNHGFGNLLYQVGLKYK